MSGPYREVAEPDLDAVERARAMLRTFDTRLECHLTGRVDRLRYNNQEQLIAAAALVIEAALDRLTAELARGRGA